MLHLRQNFTLHYPFSDDPPTLRELQSLPVPNGDSVQIIKTLAHRWERFCIAFDFDDLGTQLELIRSQHQLQGAVACCTAMFQCWLRGEGRRLPVSWNTLLEVMYEQGENRVRIQLMEALQVQ